MKFESPEVQDAVTEFAYDAQANYAYEKMKTSTTPAEKLAWKTKMVTNKCARATLINARAQAKYIANVEKKIASLTKKLAANPKAVHPNTMKWWKNRLLDQ